MVDIKTQLELSAALEAEKTEAYFRDQILIRMQISLGDRSLNPSYKIPFSHKDVRRAEDLGVKILHELQPFNNKIDCIIKPEPNNKVLPPVLV